MKLIPIILEILGWLQITVGVTLVAALPAFIIYLQWSTQTGKIVAICLLALGFIAGAAWATRIWKKYGTVAWLSRIRKIS